METGLLLIKNGHSTGNFNSLRGNLNYIMDTVTLKLIEDESQSQKPVIIINILSDDIHRTCP